MTLLRRVGNHAFTRLVNMLYGTKFTDLCNGYCAFRRTIVDGLKLTADGVEIEVQLIARAVLAGAELVEVTSFERRRVHGQSNVNTFRDGWRVLRTLLRARITRAPDCAQRPSAIFSRVPAVRRRTPSSAGDSG